MIDRAMGRAIIKNGMVGLAALGPTELIEDAIDGNPGPVYPLRSRLSGAR